MRPGPGFRPLIDWLAPLARVVQPSKLMAEGTVEGAGRRSHHPEKVAVAAEILEMLVSHFSRARLMGPQGSA